jgi:glycerol-3-phosphate dehydrogenase
VVRVSPSLYQLVQADSQNSKVFTPYVPSTICLESADVQAKEVHLFLKAKGRTEGYPLFEKVYNICWEGLEVEKLTEGL